MEIRDYRPPDGTACHELRRGAFLGVFSDLLPESAVQAGAESYSAAAFTERIGAMETFVVLVGDLVGGFCTIRVSSPTRAELLYLYVSPDHRGSGVGSQLVRHSERRALSAHPEIKTIFLDTVVPEYNQLFWEKMGYRPEGESVCEYPTGTIVAVRLEKKIDSP
jgi:GNAT superfamily N-acetyltransferase